MVLTILIAFASLIGLIVLHEFGHFIWAKHFGVKVEEFGIGIPPRIFGRKIGETIYSLNLLPIGAFVRLYGEEENIKNPRSFTGKPIWQRALIIAGGVVTFWIVAFILLTVIAGKWGLPTAVEDDASHGLIDSKVQIIKVLPESPAEQAGLEMGDIIKQLTINNYQLSIDKVKQVQEFTEINKGKEVILTVQRGKEVFETSLVPRISPPEEEGPIGIGLARIANKTYSWYEAPVQGAIVTATTTIAIPYVLGGILWKAIKGKPIKEKVELRGPVGIGEMMSRAAEQGISHFLYFLAMISIFLAVFNILPIPVVDGGKLLFLGIEKVRGKPINEKFEQNISAVFFFLLITLMIWVTIKDIARLF